MTAMPGARESDIKEPAFFGVNEWLCTRQDHAKQRIIFDAGRETIHASVAAQDENIVGLESFRPMQGQELKVEAVGEFRLPIQEGARAKMIEPAKDPYAGLPCSGGRFERQRTKLRSKYRIDIFIARVFQYVNRRSSPTIYGPDAFGDLRWVSLNERRCGIGNALIAPECRRQERCRRRPILSLEICHQTLVRAGEAIDRLPVIPDCE
jgi:hypothetical protein